MGAFFDREVKRLEFTTERTAMRANEKKAMDAATMEREKVSCWNDLLHGVLTGMKGLFPVE